MNQNNVVQLSEKANQCHIDSNNEENWLMLAAVNGESGDLAEALRCADQAIELDGTYVEAYLTRAHLLQKVGKDLEAINSAQKAVEVDDEYDEAWLFLGGLAGKLKRFDESEKWSERAVELLPGNIDALLNLANAQYELAKYIEAENTFRRILELQQDHMQAQLGLIRSIIPQTKYDEALGRLEPIIAKMPDNLEALHCQAMCYQRMDKFDTAKEVYEQLIKLDQDYVPSYLGYAEILESHGDYLEAIRILKQLKIDSSENKLDVLGRLAKIYHDFGMHLQAIESCDEALMIEPDNKVARFYKALALGDSAHLEEGLAELENLEKSTPDDPKIIGAKASLLEKLGEYDRAHDLIKRYFEGGKIPVGIVDIYSRLCHRYDECDNAIMLMNESLDNNTLAKDYRRGLLFTLAKLHDRLGNFEEAFTRIEEANRLKNYKYDHDRYVKYVDRLISPKVTEVLNQTNSWNYPDLDIQPVFIVGMPRSGTSLIEQILASHPQVFGGGERHEISSLSQKLPLMEGVHGEYPECLTDINSEIIAQILEAYEAFTQDLPPETTILTDKMPENFHHLVFIRLLFPNSRIIHCVRSPLDTCLSCYFQDFTGYHDYAYDLVDLGKRHLEYQRLMSHYRDITGIPMLEVHYEDLVHDTEAWTRRIIDFCDLEWDEQCLRFYESDRVVRTASYDQVKEPVYTRAIDKWKHYESHLRPLIDVLNVKWI